MYINPIYFNQKKYFITSYHHNNFMKNAITTTKSFEKSIFMKNVEEKQEIYIVYTCEEIKYCHALVCNIELICIQV